MHHHRTPFRALLFAVLIGAPGALLAQATAPGAAPSGPASVSPPHERLAFFEGLWTVEEVPPAREFRERCAWMEGGRRHMICRSRSRNAAGVWREGLSMFSYRPADSAYVYYGLRSSGAAQMLTGRVDAPGEYWEFRGEEGQGAARERTLVRIAKLAGGRFRFVEQVARGDAPFASADTVHYRPARGEAGVP
jgi:hypothetical protein